MFVLQNRKNNYRSMPMYNERKHRDNEIQFMINRFENNNYRDNFVNEVKNDKPKIKEMTWGEPTWFFFHTLAEKIKEEYFSDLRDILLRYITRICNNLPCPDCTSHASNYLRSVNFDNIQTKEDLKHMLWKFHNVINQRKGYMLFPYEDLNTKYSSAITMNIVRNFFYHYSRKQYNVRLSMDNLNRRNILKEMQLWLEKNADKFHA